RFHGMGGCDETVRVATHQSEFVRSAPYDEFDKSHEIVPSREMRALSTQKLRDCYQGPVITNRTSEVRRIGATASRFLDAPPRVPGRFRKMGEHEANVGQ